MTSARASNCTSLDCRLSGKIKYWHKRVYIEQLRGELTQSQLSELISSVDARSHRHHISNIAAHQSALNVFDSTR